MKELRINTRFGTQHSYISFNETDNGINIERVFTSEGHRRKGEFKKTLSKFVERFNKSDIHVCLMPDRKPNGEYDHELENNLSKTFKSFGFVPTEYDGEFYDTDLELIRN
jgi:hypothetical protein